MVGIMVSVAISSSGNLHSGGGGGDPSPSAPVNVAPPSIDIGDGLVGTTATSTPAVWDDPGYTITQQWCTNGFIISGATATTFTLTGGIAGQTLTMRETATNAGGSTDANSNGDTTEALSAPTLSGATIIEARGWIGDEMESGFSYGSFGNPPTTDPVVYEWKEGTDPYVVGNDTHVIAALSTDYYLRVSLTNGQGTGSATSAPYSSAGNVGATNLTAPTAVAQGGFSLAVTSDGTWSGNPAPTLASYQWQYEDIVNGWTDISAANGSSHSGMAMVNYRCVVSYFNAGGSASQNSNEVVAVA